MYVLDTDTLTHLLVGHERVAQRRAAANREVVLTVVNRIEVLQGRFASVLKAEDGEKLLRAHQRLVETERDLAKFLVLPIDVGTVAEFDRLLKTKKLNIGLADLLIAAITQANGATLVTRNQKDFRKIPGLKLENWID